MGQEQIFRPSPSGRRDPQRLRTRRSVSPAASEGPVGQNCRERRSTAGLSCPSGPRGGGERDWEGTGREGAAQIIEEACVCEQECECVSACADPQENKTKHIP